MLRIGVIDSGIGGISLIKGMLQTGVRAEFSYIYDNKYHPYGTKAKGELTSLAYKHISELLRQDVDMIVFACNTLTSSCIDIMRNIFYLPIIGVEPPVKPAVSECDNIVVMATPFTVQGEKLHSKVVQYTEKSFYYPYMPELATLIEQNIWRVGGENVIREYLNEKLIDYTGIDGVVIGCTHYNFVLSMISDILPDAKIYSSVSGVADRVKSICECSSFEYADGSIIKLLPTGDIPSSALVDYLAKYLFEPVIIDVPYYIT